MADKLKTIEAAARIAKGGIVFAHELDTIAAGNFRGMVMNSEIMECTGGGFTWFCVWKMKDSESVADKAAQIAAALTGEK